MLVAVDGSGDPRQALQRGGAQRQPARRRQDDAAPGERAAAAARRREPLRRRPHDRRVPPRARRGSDGTDAELLKTLGITAQEHLVTGEPGPAIADAARSFGCDLIVMGARGLGGAGAALLGSATLGAIEHAGVPVLVVK
ncbi:MAG: universal stress protein [Rubrivivax sp.]